jgi:hypothetical protein
MKLSIRDVLIEAIQKGMNESQAIAHCRSRIHIPRVSNKRMKEYYQNAASEKKEGAL